MARKFIKVIAGAAAIGYFALGGFLVWLLNDNVNDAVDGRMAAYVEEHSELEVDPDKVAIVARICTKLYVMVMMPAELIMYGIKCYFKHWSERRY